MKSILMLMLCIAFVIVISKIGQYLLKKIEKSEEIQDQEYETKKVSHDYKEVLKKENCSSSKKPFQDYNDKQNLTKFNHGTYRDEKGRFKSNKQWKKEHETS